MRESRTLEFKQDFTRNVFKTISAFANFNTGKIVFGVNDNGDVVGIENPDAFCLKVENAINDSVEPVPRYTLEVKDYEKRQVVALTVYEGKDKPYLYRGRAYKRSDTADIEVDRLELNRLILEGQNLSFEQVVSEDQALNFSILAESLLTRAGVEDLNKDVLRTLRLCTKSGDYNNAAAILADENRFCGTDIVRFGESSSIILDRKRIIGVSALAQLEEAIKMFRQYYQYEVIEGADRIVRELVPEEAFREAMANALVHRLWDLPANVQVSMESTGITIMSPGGLPAGITLEEYVDGRISLLRNPIVGNVFHRLNYIEMFGTGTARIKETYEPYGYAPVFQVTENTISVTLPSMGGSRALSAEEIEQLDLIPHDRLLSRREVEKLLGVSQAKAGRLLTLLVDRGVMKKSGAGRSTRYERLR